MSLDFSGTGDMVDHPTAVAALGSFSSVRQIVARDVRLPAASLRQLPALPSKALEVDIDLSTVGHLEQCLQLHGRVLEDLTVSTFAEFQTLQVDTVLSAVCRSVPLIRSLRFWKHAPCSASNIAQLAGLSKLTSLSFKLCPIDDEAVCRLSSLTNLHSLGLVLTRNVRGAHGSMACLASNLQQLTCLDLLFTNALAAAQEAFGSRVVEVVDEKLTIRPSQLGA